MFVGRKDESGRLRAAIRRSPVSVVCGPGGIGKSSFVLHVLHRHFPKRVPRTLLLALRPAEGAVSLGEEVARALAEALEVKRFDWSDLLADPDALAAAAIDLAEAGDWWVVVDDLQYGDPEEVRAFLARVSRYARDSRWIATSRVDPGVAGLEGQVIPIGPLSDTDAESLAHACAPSRTRADLKEAVAEAKGSPWRIRRLAAEGDEGVAGSVASLVGGLPDETADLLRVLSQIEAPIPKDAAEKLSSAVATADLELLEARGLIERGEGGVKLHDMARVTLAAALTPRDVRAYRSRAAEVLALRPEPECAIEALRLLLELEQTHDVEAMLAKRGEALLAAGRAPSLWRLLEDETGDRRLARFRLRIAVELGSPAALAKIADPVDAPPDERLLWARALRQQGQHQGAAKVAAEIRDAAAKAGNAPLAFEAGLLRARCFVIEGSVLEALQALDALTAPNEEGTARRDVLIARCASSLSQPERALTILAGLESRAAPLPPAIRAEIGFDAAWALWQMGRLVEAGTIVDRIANALGGDLLAFYQGRGIAGFKAFLAIDGGRLGEARAILARVRPVVGASSLLRPYFDLGAWFLALTAGETEGLETALESSMEEAVRRGRRDHYHAAASMRLRLGLLRAEGKVTLAGIDSLGSSAHYTRFQRLYEIQRGVREGVPLDPNLMPAEAERASSVEVRHLSRTIETEALLLAGNASSALEHARVSVAEITERGFRVLEAAARQTLCDALLLSGRFAEAATTASSLLALAESMPSPRFAIEAALARTCASAAPDPGLLEAIAGQAFTAPVAARRARALLGGTPPLDGLDRRVLDAVRAQSAWIPIRVLQSNGPGWNAGWGLDGLAKSVWLPGGNAVDLSRHLLLWKLLSTLADRGARATKEDLVRAVWEESEYHPLRHDNRLQAAVRKIREAIEENASKPERLVTTPDGYALGGVVRRR